MQLFTRLIKQVDCTGYDLNQPLGVSLQACRLSAILKFPSCALGSSWAAEVLLSLAFIPETLWSLGHYDICLPITPLLLVAATKAPTLTPHQHTHLWELPHPNPCSSDEAIHPLVMGWTQDLGGQSESLPGEYEFWVKTNTQSHLTAEPHKTDPQGPCCNQGPACSLDSVVPLKLEPLQYPSFKK